VIKSALSLTLFAALAFSAAATAQPVSRPKANVETGIVVGSAANGVNSFKAVPFALPPVGALRWQPPQKPLKWSGERDATHFALPCAQPVNADGKSNGGGVSGATGEDCLYLNVWAPANAKGAPVMLWLYGGAGYLGGANLGSYDGSSFARDGVIVITANYRLGAMGAFAHPALTKAAKPGEPLGGYALMDAVAALEWVQRNAAAFGGAPKNVTLFGQSAGGAMVLSLLSTPSAKGLYAKAIIESGAALRPGLSMADAEAAGAKAATALGLPGAAATADQLRALPIGAFVDNKDAQRGTGAPLDGRLRTQSTEDALKAKTAIDVPLIVGTNNGEGGADSARAVVALASSGAPAYLYQFSYVPTWRTGEQPNGAPHSAEIPYVFDSLATAATGGGAKVTDRDRQVAARIHSCWVAFAKSAAGAKALTCASGFTWPAYSAGSDQVVVFGETPKVAKAATLPPFKPGVTR
jgi:para-nitrobenzyl esterase